MALYSVLALVFVLEVMRIGRHRIINKMIATESMSPESAKTFKETDIGDLFSAKVLLISGIIKEVDGEKYYLDLARKMKIANLRPIVILAFMAIGFLTYFLTR